MIASRWLRDMAKGRLEMGVLSDAVDGIVRAIFGYEFDDAGAVDAAVATIRSGRLDEWVLALADSGMFPRHAVDRIEAAWRADPDLLVETIRAA